MSNPIDDIVLLCSKHSQKCKKLMQILAFKPKLFRIIQVDHPKIRRIITQSTKFQIKTVPALLIVKGRQIDIYEGPKADQIITTIIQQHVLQQKQQNEEQAQHLQEQYNEPLQHRLHLEKQQQQRSNLGFSTTKINNLERNYSEENANNNLSNVLNNDTNNDSNNISNQGFNEILNEDDMIRDVSNKEDEHKLYRENMYRQIPQKTAIFKSDQRNEEFLDETDFNNTDEQTIQPNYQKQQFSGVIQRTNQEKESPRRRKSKTIKYTAEQLMRERNESDEQFSRNKPTF